MSIEKSIGLRLIDGAAFGGPENDGYHPYSVIDKLRETSTADAVAVDANLLARTIDATMVEVREAAFREALAIIDRRHADYLKYLATTDLNDAERQYWKGNRDGLSYVRAMIVSHMDMNPSPANTVTEVGVKAEAILADVMRSGKTVEHGDKVKAIAIWRRHTAQSLVDSKNAIEAIYDAGGPRTFALDFTKGPGGFTAFAHELSQLGINVSVHGVKHNPPKFGDGDNMFKVEAPK